MTRHTFAIVCALLMTLVIANAAQAVYHPTLGRYAQRDPHGTAVSPDHRPGTALKAEGAFAERDPLELAVRNEVVPSGHAFPDRGHPSSQYVDGMNLYQYVRSDPLHRIDPSGMTSVCPRNTCDRWEIEVETIGGGGMFLGTFVIDTTLRAVEGESPGYCCMDEVPRQYRFASFGVGFSVGGGGADWGGVHEFTTDQCISYDEHRGWGMVGSAGAAAIGGVAGAVVRTPQTWFTSAGLQLGLEVDFGSGFVGRWWFP